MTIAILFTAISVAALTWITRDQVIISLVMVNGGTDTLNPGTSCIQIDPPASECTGGYIYIPNNNKQLLGAAISANTSKARSYVQFVSDAQSGHCPGQVFTNCSLNSLGIK